MAKDCQCRKCIESSRTFGTNESSNNSSGIFSKVFGWAFFIMLFGFMAYLMLGCSKNQINEPHACRQPYVYELRDSTGVISRGEWEEDCPQDQPLTIGSCCEIL